MYRNVRIVLYAVLFLTLVIWGSTIFSLDGDPIVEKFGLPVYEEEDENIHAPEQEEDQIEEKLFSQESAFDKGIEDTEYFSLNAEDVIWNFFGYLQAGNYKNAATFIHPDYYVPYFYSNNPEERFQTFGSAIVGPGIENVTISEQPRSFGRRYYIRANVTYTDGLTKDIDFLVVTESEQNHAEVQDAYIDMRIEDILKQVE